MEKKTTGIRLNKQAAVLIAVIYMLCGFPPHAVTYAAARDTEKEGWNIVLLVDHSGSMNTLDGQGVIAGECKAFVDVLREEAVKIGYVAYDDTILAQQAPVSVSSRKKRRKLKKVIGSVDNGGETDIGLGLRRAYQLLADCSGKRMIVLVSDGDTDLDNSNTGRTEADSEKDVETVARKCRKEKIAVSSIMLGKENEGTLRDIAADTGGESYSLQKAADLFEVLCNLYYTAPSNCIRGIGVSTYSIQEAADSIYGEGSQKISYEVTAEYEELTLLLFSDREIRNVQFWHGEGTEEPDALQPELAGNYALYKTDNGSGTYTVRFDTGARQQAMLFAIGRRDGSPEVEWLGSVGRNRETGYKLSFLDKEGNAIPLLEFSDPAAWHAQLENRQTGESLPSELEAGTQELSGTVTFTEAGSYALRLSMGEAGVLDAAEVEVPNAPPVLCLDEAIELLTVSGQKLVDLDDYFTDEDGDGLTYSIGKMPDRLVKAQILEHTLLVEPLKRGSGEIEVLASDGESSTTGTIPVRARSIFEVYWQAVLLLLCILAFCTIKLYRRKKTEVRIPEPPKEKSDCSFTGKLNIYATLLPEQMEEVPPLTFALHPVREKRIALGDLCSDYPQLIDLLILDRIYLYPAEERKLLLYHDSDSSVMIGNSIVCRRMQYSVSYGNVIYITSKDGTCELEVHYISMI